MDKAAGRRACTGKVFTQDVSVLSLWCLGRDQKSFILHSCSGCSKGYSAPNICIAKWLQDAIWKTPKNSCPFNRFFWARGVRLMKSLTPHLGPEGEVVGIELCPNEPSIIGKHGVRPSVSSSGFALLHLLPLCVYVKFGNCLDWPFPEQPCEQHQISGADANCHWKFHAGQASKQKSFSITVLRWQLPLAPANQKHYTRYKAWRRNLALKPTGHFLLTCLQKQKWLATYVMLSRPRVNYFLCSCASKAPEIVQQFRQSMSCACCFLLSS